MDLIVLGMNHETAPLEVRERFDFSKYPSESYLQALIGRASISGGMVLSTCNRVEIYAAGASHDRLLEDARRFWGDFHNVGESGWQQFVYAKTNREAVKHLFRVAASLDSMVVGEPQILGQVKDAYLAAAEASTVDPFLDRLIRKTFSVAKRIRSETKISEQAVSISFAAVELAKKIFGDLKGKRVMILGAGQMAELAARHLRKQGVEETLFANRSYAHAVELAREYEGVPIQFEQFPHYLPQMDIVIVSTAAPNYLVLRDQVAQILERRRQAPMFFIDISVPRNVDPAIHELEDVYLYNIDDLKGIVDTNLRARAEEASKAEAIVEAEVARFYETVEKLEVVPVIQEIQEKFEAVRKGELARLSRRLQHLSEEDRAEIERTTESLTRKLLSRPILFLREESSKERQLERVQWIRKIFGLSGRDDGES